MSLYPDIEQDFYFVVMNGEPIQPANTDMVMDYATAVTVQDFLQAVCPYNHFEIVKAVFIDDTKPQPPKRPNTANLRVLG